MQTLAIGLLGLYRATLSRVLPPRCRFHPTCSAYAMQALRRHGLVRGLLLTLWRVARCNPLFPGGFDPAPETFGPGAFRFGPAGLAEAPHPAGSAGPAGPAERANLANLEA